MVLINFTPCVPQKPKLLENINLLQADNEQSYFHYPFLSAWKFLIDLTYQTILQAFKTIVHELVHILLQLALIKLW